MNGTKTTKLHRPCAENLEQSEEDEQLFSPTQTPAALLFQKTDISSGMLQSCVKRCRRLWGRGSYWEQKPNESLSSFRGLNYPAAPFFWPTDLFQRFTKGVNDPWPLWAEGRPGGGWRRREDEGGWRRMKVSLQWSDPASRHSQQTDRPTLLFETRSGWSAASSGSDPTLSGERTLKQTLQSVGRLCGRYQLVPVCARCRWKCVSSCLNLSCKRTDNVRLVSCLFVAFVTCCVLTLFLPFTCHFLTLFSLLSLLSFIISSSSLLPSHVLFWPFSSHFFQPFAQLTSSPLCLFTQRTLGNMRPVICFSV